MNFLERAKQTANQNSTAEVKSPMGNPLINQTQKPVLPSSKPGLPKPPTGGLPKPPIGGLPKPPGAAIPKVAPIKKEEAVVPEVKEEKVKAIDPVIEEAEVKVDAPEVKEEVAEVTPEPEKKKKRRKKTAKAETSNNESNDAVTTEISKEKTVAVKTEAVDIPETTLSFAECVDTVSSQFIDEEWLDIKESLIQKQIEIVISSDMNKALLFDALTQLAELKDSIFVMHNDAKVLYESLIAKEDGLIDRVKKLNAKGSNAEERKVSGTIAAMNYTSPNMGGNINLFELLDEARSRHYFLKSLMDQIEYKKAVLLTMLSSLKSEK